MKMMCEVLGPTSEYETEPVNSYSFDKSSQKLTLPIKAPWRNASLKDFLRKVDNGIYCLHIMFAFSIFVIYITFA